MNFNTACIIRRAAVFDFIGRISEPYGYLKVTQTGSYELAFNLALSRHLQNEATASAGRAFQFDFPAMRQDNLACDVQPQPHAFHNPASLTSADKRLKDFFLLVESDA